MSVRGTMNWVLLTVASIVLVGWVLSHFVGLWLLMPLGSRYGIYADSYAGVMTLCWRDDASMMPQLGFQVGTHRSTYPAVLRNPYLRYLPPEPLEPGPRSVFTGVDYYRHLPWFDLMGVGHGKSGKGLSAMAFTLTVSHLMVIAFCLVPVGWMLWRRYRRRTWARGFEVEPAANGTADSAPKSDSGGGAANGTEIR